MIKHILISFFMLFNLYELYAKGIIYNDTPQNDQSFNSNTNNYFSLSDLYSNCLDLRTKITDMVQKTLNKNENHLNRNALKTEFYFNIVDIENTHQLIESLNSLSIFLNNIKTIQLLMNDFEDHFINLTTLVNNHVSIRQQTANKSDPIYGNQKCSFGDFYNETSLLRPKAMKMVKNNICYRINYYRFRKCAKKFKSSNDSIEKFSKIISKPISIRISYRNLMTEVASLIKKNSKQNRTRLLPKKCNLINYYKMLLINTTTIPVNSTNSTINSTIKNTRYILSKIKNQNNKTEVLDYYKTFAFKNVSTIIRKMSIDQTVFRIENKFEKVNIKNACNLNQLYKFIFYDKKKSKSKRFFKLKDSCILLDYYKHLMFNFSKSNNFLKEYKNLTKKFKAKKVCELNQYYQELIFNISRSLLNSNKNRLDFKRSTELRSVKVSYSEHSYLMLQRVSKCPKVLEKNVRVEKKFFKKNLKKENSSNNSSNYQEWFIHLAPPKIFKQNETKMIFSNSAETQSLITNTINTTNERKTVRLNECDKRIQIDCYDYYKQGYIKNTILSIRPTLKPDCTKVKISCDMKSNGYTVILRRKDGSVDFNRNWNDYKNGFGEPDKDHWIGNDMIYYLTNQLNYSLRIDLEDWEGNKKIAIYDLFRIESEENGYQLIVNGYSGDAGDSFGTHNGKKFSTIDMDNDEAPEWFHGGNCAKRFGGGWWFGACYKSNLNGNYYLNGLIPSKKNDGIAWNSWRSSNYSLKFVEMKIRRNFQKRL